MSKTQPIRKTEDIRKLKKFYIEREEYRNYLLITVGINTALRICDMLTLKWTDVFIGSSNNFRTHISLEEKKTGKQTCIYINHSVKAAIRLYISKCGKNGEYIFANRNGEPLSRYQAFKIISSAGKQCGFEEKISCHSLRKTFGYHAWKRGTPPAVLMQIYNHSSYDVTRRYLGIVQEDKDEVYREVEL